MNKKWLCVMILKINMGLFEEFYIHESKKQTDRAIFYKNR